MNPHHQAVENIISSFISKSRKNSDTSLSFPPTQKEADRQQIFGQDQQFIIRMADLNEFVQKIANQSYEQNCTIQALKLELQELKNMKLVSVERQEHRLITSNSESKESFLRHSLSELQAKYDGEKKRREHLQRQVKWSNNRIKEQLSEIQRLKHLIATKDSLIQKISQKQEWCRTEQAEQFYNTPGAKKSELLPTVYSQEYYTSSENYQKEKEEQVKRTYPTAKTKQSHIQDQNQKATGIIKREKLTNSDQEQFKVFRHSDIDRKDRLLRQLGEKCLYLQGHIQILTRKILGEFFHQKPELCRSLPIQKGEQNMPQKKTTSNMKRIEHIQDEGNMFKVDID